MISRFHHLSTIKSQNRTHNHIWTIILRVSSHLFRWSKWSERMDERATKQPTTKWKIRFIVESIPRQSQVTHICIESHNSRKFHSQTATHDKSSFFVLLFGRKLFCFLFLLFCESNWIMFVDRAHYSSTQNAKCNWGYSHYIHIIFGEWKKETTSTKKKNRKTCVWRGGCFIFVK